MDKTTQDDLAVWVAEKLKLGVSRDPIVRVLWERHGSWENQSFADELLDDMEVARLLARWFDDHYSDVDSGRAFRLLAFEDCPGAILALAAICGFKG